MWVFCRYISQIKELDWHKNSWEVPGTCKDLHPQWCSQRNTLIYFRKVKSEFKRQKIADILSVSLILWEIFQKFQLQNEEEETVTDVLNHSLKLCNLESN